MALTSVVHGQNGRIIDQQVFTLDDSVAKATPEETRHPCRYSAGRDEGDHLPQRRPEGKGLPACAEERGRYPVMIYNRGGCKDFGALRGLGREVALEFCELGIRSCSQSIPPEWRQRREGPVRRRRRQRRAEPPAAHRFITER